VVSKVLLELLDGIFDELFLKNKNVVKIKNVKNVKSVAGIKKRKTFRLILLQSSLHALNSTKLLSPPQPTRPIRILISSF